MIVASCSGRTRRAASRNSRRYPTRPPFARARARAPSRTTAPMPRETRSPSKSRIASRRGSSMANVLDLRELLRVRHERETRAGVRQDVAHLLGRERRIHGHGDRARGQDRQIRQQPLGPALRHDRHAIAGRHADAESPSERSRSRSNQSRVEAPSISSRPRVRPAAASDDGRGRGTAGRRASPARVLARLQAGPRRDVNAGRFRGSGFANPEPQESSVPRRLVDDVEQRLTGDETSQIVGEESGDVLPELGVEARDVRRDEHVGAAPQRTLSSKRLVLEDVERRAAQAPALERRDAARPRRPACPG